MVSAAGVRRLGLSMKFGRYTAHRRIQHACGARQQDSFAHLPHPFVCGFVASLPDAARGPFQSGVGLPRDHGAAPAILGLSNGEMPSIGHEPSGISVRILVEGSPGAHRRTAREGHAKRPCGRVDVWGSEPHARMTETTPDLVPRWHSFSTTPILLQIGQNQVPATHRTSSSYHPRAPPQPYVQYPGTSAAIKARNPRLLRKQTQHH